MPINIADLGNIVQEYKIGNTTIKICDGAYRNNTPEDNKRIHDGIIRVGWKIIKEARARGVDV